MDRMRESLFSILGSLDGMSFLDLFSGSGLIGIEAASRGASPVHLVEKDYGKKKVITDNMAMVEEDIRLFLVPADRYIRKCEDRYDVIHLDPPFPLNDKLRHLQLIADKELLIPGGTLMMHYPGEEQYPDEIGDLRRYDLRRYGRSHLIFYTRD